MLWFDLGLPHDFTDVGWCDEGWWEWSSPVGLLLGLPHIPLISHTNASVKSYQLVKVVSGGRAPGKSSSLASPQLLVIEQFHCFVAVLLLPSVAAAAASTCCCCCFLLLLLPAAVAAAASCCYRFLLLLLLLPPAAAAASSCCCCFLLLLLLLLLLPPAAVASSCCCRSCKHFAETENNSLGRLVWRWREVRRETPAERGNVLAGWNETLRSHSAVVSLCSPSAPSRTISQDGAADGKTAQDGTDTTDGADGAPTKPATLSARNGMKVFFQFAIPGWIGQQNFLRAVHDIDAHRALQEIWGCTNRGLVWSRDAGHQYNILKSNRISCRESVCINLCPSKSSLCAMLRPLLTTSPSMDETGCAMVILLPWCDFPLPDVTSPYRRRAMGMMWLFPPDVT